MQNRLSIVNMSRIGNEDLSASNNDDTDANENENMIETGRFDCLESFLKTFRLVQQRNFQSMLLMLSNMLLRFYMIQMEK